MRREGKGRDGTLTDIATPSMPSHIIGLGGNEERVVPEIAWRQKSNDVMCRRKKKIAVSGEE